MRVPGTATTSSQIPTRELNQRRKVESTNVESMFKPSEGTFYRALSDGNLAQIEHCLRYYTPNTILKNPDDSNTAKPYHFLTSIWIKSNAPEIAKLIFTHSIKAELDDVFKSNLRFMVSYGMDHDGIPVEKYLPLIAEIAKHCPEISIETFHTPKDVRYYVPISSTALQKIDKTISDVRNSRAYSTSSQIPARELGQQSGLQTTTSPSIPFPLIEDID